MSVHPDTSYNISHPSGFSLQAHIYYMEELYVRCEVNSIAPDIREDIFTQIKELQKKLSEQAASDSSNPAS